MTNKNEAPLRTGPQGFRKTAAQNRSEGEADQGPGTVLLVNPVCRTACSFFRNAQDNKPRSWAGAWERLADDLQRIRHPQTGLEGDDAKKSLPALCAATFLPGLPRARENVAGVHLLLLDFDNAREEPTGELHSSGRAKTRKVPLDAPVDMDVVQSLLERTGVGALAWSTWSDKPTWPKFRVVLPLTSPIEAALWPRAAEWALETLGLGSLRAAIDGPVLRNPAALAFLPAAPDPSSIRFFRLEGGPLSIPLDELPTVRPPDHELFPRERTRIEARADDEWWKRYRVKGRPVDFNALDLAPILERLGCKVGEARPWKGGTKRRCTCPWAREHSGGVDDDAAVIFSEPGKWPSFVCLHSGHVGLGLREILEEAWGRL